MRCCHYAPHHVTTIMVCRFVSTVAALALTLVIPTYSHGGNLEHIAISGWYPECLFEGDIGDSCLGNFAESAEPADIDSSGNTCYVNPLITSNTTAGVFWFGPLANKTGTYMYTALLLGDNVTAYKPTNCMENGACECGPFDDFRGSEWKETGGCGGQCAFLPAGGLEGLVGEDCAILTRVTTTYMNETVGTCPILGKVIDTGGSPTTSGGGMVFVGPTVVFVTLIIVVSLDLWPQCCNEG